MSVSNYLESSFEKPMVSNGKNVLSWSETADVVIVGLGGAGVVTALEALEGELSVCAIDKFNCGGSTQASGGVVYAGGGTSVQIEAGVNDTTEHMFKYLKMETEDIVSDDTLRDFCNKSTEAVAWLQRFGVQFPSTLWSDKTSYPGLDYFLYHSDNSLVTHFQKKAKPAARGHRAFLPVERGKKILNEGEAIFDPLQASALKRGLKMMTYSEVQQLVVDDKGDVIGVKVAYFTDEKVQNNYIKYRQKAEKLMAIFPPIMPGYGFFSQFALANLAKAKKIEEKRKIKYVKANKAVVLSAGGFMFNPKMLQHYAPKYMKAYPLGTEGDNGSGIQLGQSVGSKIGHMHRLTIWRFINPPLSFVRGLIVNQKGKRFIDETVYGAKLGLAIVEDHDGKAWMILDKSLIKSALKEVKGGNILPFQRDLARLNIWFATKKANTIEDLAKKIGIPPEVLTQEVKDYHQIESGDVEDVFGKKGKDIARMDTPPFYAIDIGIAAKLFPCPAFTLGGIMVDERSGQVLKEEGDVPIKGLYAAGRNAVGICSQNYVSGLSIADCVYSGRRVGRHIKEMISCVN